MERSGDAVAKLGRSLRMMNLDRYFEQEPEFSVSEPVTKQKATAANKHIEDHYKNHHQSLQDRSERRLAVKRKRQEEQVTSDVKEEMMRALTEKEAEFMRL
ncbi:hypothetical protein DCAR_0418340 [Daucus carota subsp. sativus]|uniref:Uncharacterized protein n=1 Tax=Daucus carota subsp. sativus TaxID=79200 RepID=A0A165ZC56_DAUCS|nr:hypothetical protein DCAR_0418340 [Daucus carota subsp. sativus]